MAIRLNSPVSNNMKCITKGAGAARPDLQTNTQRAPLSVEGDARRPASRNEEFAGHCGGLVTSRSTASTGAGRPCSFVLGVLLAFTVVNFSSCKKEDPPPPPLPPAAKLKTTVATVNGEPITIDQMLQAAAKQALDLNNPRQAEQALKEAVNYELLVQEAKKLGYFDDPEVQELIRSMAVQKLVRNKVDNAQPTSVPKDEELKGYYDQHKADFTQPSLVRGQVLFLVKRAAEDANHSQKLEQAKQAIAAKEDFGGIVKRLSDNPADQADGGLSQWLQEGKESQRYPKAVVDALFSTKDREAILGPFDSPQGTWFCRVAERRDARTASFEEAKGRIAQEMIKTRRQSGYDGFVEKAKGSAQITLHPERLTEALKEQAKTPTSGPPMGPVRLGK